MRYKVLLVDHEAASQEQCSRVLRDCGCQVRTVNSGTAATKLLATAKFDVLVIDFRLATSGEVNLVTTATRVQPELKIVLMVEGTGFHANQQPLRLQGYSLLAKPLRIEEVTRVLEALPQGSSAVGPGLDVARSAAERFARFVGTSESIKKIHRLIAKVATRRHPVLITGESGTGKELVARAIHGQGPWSDQPFVPVDCGAMPSTLIESELFGHIKGAFTGAAHSRQGLLAAAGKGTVFLDEIGELPVELQSRLLRALQEHEVRPLGGNERVRFEARIIAATNRDLHSGIERGVFRKDLFFRLNVVSIKVPPLRDRREDIPILIRHFLARFKSDDSAKVISDEALGRLISYDWPGNVRELENCIHRVVSLVSGSLIQVPDLCSGMLQTGTSDSTARRDLAPLKAIEKQAIAQALQAAGGDRVRAARILGIGKTTIYRKVKEYELHNPADVVRNHSLLE